MREVLSDNAHPELSRHTPPAQQISQHAMRQKMGNDSMNNQTSRQMQQTYKQTNKQIQQKSTQTKNSQTHKQIHATNK